MPSATDEIHDASDDVVAVRQEDEVTGVIVRAILDVDARSSLSANPRLHPGARDPRVVCSVEDAHPRFG